MLQMNNFHNQCHNGRYPKLLTMHIHKGKENEQIYNEYLHWMELISNHVCQYFCSYFYLEPIFEVYQIDNQQTGHVGHYL